MNDAERRESIRNVMACANHAISMLHTEDIDRLGTMILRARRVFTVGNGGSAAHASHCACDLTKLARKPTICLNDNQAAYSAGVNDDKLNVYREMLERFGFGRADDDAEASDMLLIFSVGGGSTSKGVSSDLVYASHYAYKRGSVAAVVGRVGDVVAHLHVTIECPVAALQTPVVESIMPLVWHALVAGPLKREEPVWR